MNYGFYLKNIFINPVKASRALLEEKRPWNVAIWSWLVGAILYVIVVLLGYHALNWSEFPYKEYYPHYFTPFWWEVFVVPVWGLVIALGYGVSCYYLGRLFGGKAGFIQTLALVLLASIVSLPIFIAVDVLTILYDPEWIIRFAKYGDNFIPMNEYRNTFVWVIETWYAAAGMTWQGIVTLIGLTILHRISWYKNIPGFIAGSAILFVFLVLIRDYVALII
jgi:hypothetical protein